MLKLIGLTGGIGSGKSTVAQIIRDQGIPVIDADVIARAVVGRGSRRIGHRSGVAEVIATGGRIDRKKLGAIVFSDAPQPCSAGSCHAPENSPTGGRASSGTRRGWARPRLSRSRSAGQTGSTNNSTAWSLYRRARKFSRASDGTRCLLSGKRTCPIMPSTRSPRKFAWLTMCSITMAASRQHGRKF